MSSGCRKIIERKFNNIPKDYGYYIGAFNYSYKFWYLPCIPPINIGRYYRRNWQQCYHADVIDKLKPYFKLIEDEISFNNSRTYL